MKDLTITRISDRTDEIGLPSGQKLTLTRDGRKAHLSDGRGYRSRLSVTAVPRPGSSLRYDFFNAAALNVNPDGATPFGDGLGFNAADAVLTWLADVAGLNC